MKAESSLQLSNLQSQMRALREGGFHSGEARMLGSFCIMDAAQSRNGLNVSSSNSHAEALIPSVPVLGDRAFRR